MPVTNVSHDIDALTLTITAEFAAPRARIWQIYADPRQLEKIWGPPTYPATVVDHEFAPGGRVTYYMTGPEGDKHAGNWNIISVDEPTGFSFTDGFADADFTPDRIDASVHQRVLIPGQGRQHHRHLRQHLRNRRRSPAGARHGRGRGRLAGDRPDRRPHQG